MGSRYPKQEYHPILLIALLLLPCDPPSKAFGSFGVLGFRVSGLGCDPQRNCSSFLGGGGGGGGEWGLGLKVRNFSALNWGAAIKRTGRYSNHHHQHALTVPSFGAEIGCHAGFIGFRV